MANRYVLCRDEAGWIVLDTATDAPAIVNDTPMIHMAEDKAQEVARLLNEIDDEKGATPLQ